MVGGSRRWGAAALVAAVVGMVLGLVSGTALAAPPAVQETGPFCTNVPADFEPFVDVTGNKANIECLAFSAITSGGPRGLPANNYGPGLTVRRNELATFLTRLIDTANRLEITALRELPSFDGSNDFVDVPANDVHLQAINRLAAVGIVRGGPGGRPANQYGPSLEVTRSQLAAFVNRTVGFLRGKANGAGEFSSSEDFFNDDETDVSEADINGVASRGIIAGFTATTYGPGRNANRDQMASFLIRTLADLFDAGSIRRLDPRSGTGVTSRPELISASILSTTTTASAMTSLPRGTTVRYTFDEPVSGGTPVAGQFFVYDFRGVRTAATTTGDEARVETGGAGGSVLVRFTDIDTPEEAALLTVATVNEGAAIDATGASNPEGDAPIGTQQTLPPPAAGVTSAPDLVSATVVMAASTANQTLVDFNFDETAFVVNGTGFRVLLTPDGTESACAATGAPATGALTVQAACTNRGATALPPNNGTTLTQADIARAYVDPGTVSDAVQVGGAPVEGNDNPLQAVDGASAAAGNTSVPDLVMATLTLTPESGVADTIDYDFDQDVQNMLITPGAFTAYDVNGNAVAGTAATRNTVDNSRVVVTFGGAMGAVPPSLESTVGASVDENAVLNGVAGSMPQPNQEDEVGVTNPLSFSITPGSTSGPDLTAVSLARAVDQFGMMGNFQATYTFDEETTDAVVPSALSLFTADGTRLTCTAATASGRAATGLRSVLCTAFGSSTSAQVGSAVLGTVDTAAVDDRDPGTNNNPEGAAATTGGTGTPMA